MGHLFSGKEILFKKISELITFLYLLEKKLYSSSEKSFFLSKFKCDISNKNLLAKKS